MADKKTELINALNQTLRNEYTLIVHSPAIAAKIKDNEAKELLISYRRHLFPGAPILFF